MSGNIIRNVLLLRRKSTLLAKCSWPQTSLVRHKQSMTVPKDQSASEIDDDEEEPIKYSKTKAYNMGPDDYRMGSRRDAPWYQSHIIMFSITVFLIYFCILREENDIDVLLDADLVDTLKELQKKKLAESSMSK